MCATALVAKYTLGLLFLIYITFLAKMKMCSGTHIVGTMRCHPAGIFILAIKESALILLNNNNKNIGSDWANCTPFSSFFPTPPQKKKKKESKKKRKKKKNNHVLEYVYILFPFLLCFSVNLIVCFSPLFKQFSLLSNLPPCCHCTWSPSLRSHEAPSVECSKALPSTPQ